MCSDVPTRTDTVYGEPFSAYFELNKPTIVLALTPATSLANVLL